MTTGLKFMIGLVGLSGLAGCSASVDEEPLGLQSSELFAGLARGVRRDYDNDGKEDAILRSVQGSSEYLGASPSGFKTGVWAATGFTSTTVDYVYGDFNGDNRSDLIITTSTGSALYTGKGGGGFTPNVWKSSSLTKGNVVFTVGDFNGDSRSDLIVGTSSKSSLYTGKTGTGGFNTDVWTSSSLTKDNASFTRGDFNGDGRTDLIVTTASGSSQYTGKSGTGGFNANVWSTSAFVAGDRFVAADFNGDGKGDFIVQTLVGIYLYTGRTTSGFNADVWAQSGGFYDKTASIVFPGEYSGDGKWDFLLATGDPLVGTLEFLGSASGNMTPVWLDSRFHLYDTTFYRGDYNGDGEDDFLAVTNDFGTFESTGINGGGFNSDVWANPNIGRNIGSEASFY